MMMECRCIEAYNVAATEGLEQNVIAAEIAYKGIISGTCVLATSQIAQHTLIFSPTNKDQRHRTVSQASTGH